MIRTPMNVHDLNHKHSPYIRALSPENATEIAITEALKLQSQVLKSCDAECNVKVPTSPVYPVAAALGPKQWLMDTGNPVRHRQCERHQRRSRKPQSTSR